MFRTVAVALTMTVAGVARVVAQDAPPTPTWGITIGAAAFAVPSYPGSKEHRVQGMPLINVTFRDRAYFGPSPSGVTFGAGYKVVRTGGLTIAPEIGFQQDRPSSRAGSLAGMTDRAVATTAGVGLSYQRGPINGGVGVAQGLNEAAGLLATAQLSLMAPVSARMFASIGAGVTFADRKQMQREFGVSAAEAARRGVLVAGGAELPADAGQAYAPAAGLRQVNASISMLRILTAHWMVVGMGSVERLGSEPSASSLVERRVQVSGGVVLGYRF